MRALWLGAAVGVAIMAVLECRRYTLDAFFALSPHTLSNSTRYHIAGAIASVRRAVIATPCMVPVLSTVPTACSGAAAVGVDHELACAGLIELLLSQRAFARSIAFHTHPSDKILSSLRVLVELNAFPAHWRRFGGLGRRWTEGMLELVTHLELAVGRIASTDLAVHGGVNGVKILSSKVTLHTAMGIVSEAITDSMSYLHAAITEARTLTGELCKRLQQDVFIAPNADDDRAGVVFAAIQDLLELEESLESLREDAGGAVKDMLRHTPRTFAALTCPVREVDERLRVLCDTLRGLGEYLGRLRVSTSLLLDWQGAAVEEAAFGPVAVPEVVSVP